MQAAALFLSENPGRDGARLARQALLLSLAVTCVYLLVGFKWFFTMVFDGVLDQWSLAFWWPVYKYVVAFALFFLAPWLAWARPNEQPARSLGWQLGNVKRGAILTAIGAVVLVGIWFSVISDPAMVAAYPLERALVDPALGPLNLPGFVAMQGLYVVLYYVPYEYFFRGVMQFPLVRHGKVRTTWVILYSTALSTLVHWDVPLTELLAALAVGFIYGLAALKCDSIWYVLAHHVAVGLVTNVACVLVLQGII